MKKPDQGKLDPAVYVVRHSMWRKSRSKVNPTVSYLDERNPRKALKKATADCVISPDGKRVIQRDVDFFTPEQLREQILTNSQ